MPDMKSATAEMRKFLKDNGIKARCRMTPGCRNSFQVFPPKYEDSFTPAELLAFNQKAIDMGCTHVRALPIDLEIEVQMTGNGRTSNFYLWD